MTAAGQNDTLPKLLLQQEAIQPNQPALRVKSRGIWQSYTWTRVVQEVNHLACGLLCAGFRRGDYLAVIGDLDWRLFCAVTAAQCLGGVAVPISADAARAELMNCLKASRVRVAIVEDEEQLQRVLAFQAMCPTLERIVVIKPEAGAASIAAAAPMSYSDLIEQGTRAAADNPSLFNAEVRKGNGQDAATAFFDVDEGGNCERVLLSHGNWIAAARASVGELNLDGKDEVLCLLSPGFVWSILFYHVQPLVAGYCVSFPEAQDTVLMDMRELGPTFLFATPNAYKQITNLTFARMEDAGFLRRGLFAWCVRNAHRSRPGAPRTLLSRVLGWIGESVICAPLKDVLGLSRVRVALSLEDRLSPDLFSFYHAIGLPLRQFYGPVRACGLLTLQKGLGAHDHVGGPVLGTEVRIGPRKEIQFRAPYASVRSRDVVEASAGGEQWVSSGQAGFVDVQGQLRLLGPLTEVGTLSDGTEFIPKVVERRLKASPILKHAVVFGLRGQFVTAFVTLEEETITAWADRNNVGYSGITELANDPRVHDLMKRHVMAVNRTLAANGHGKLQVRRFAILEQDLDCEAGELTPTKEPHRAVIAQRYSSLIEALSDSVDQCPSPTGCHTVRITTVRPAADVVSATGFTGGADFGTPARSGA